MSRANTSSARTSAPQGPLVDIGVNLTHRQFDRDRDAVVERAIEAGVETMVVTGSSLPVSRGAAELVASRPGVLWATAGVHPHHAKECDEGTIDELRRLAKLPGVVAIGECGLDFDRNFSPPDVQERWFEAQLELAAELHLPVFLHERRASQRFVEILGRHRPKLVRAVAHCFTGSAEELDRYLELDLHIGITGWICDPRRGAHLLELVGRIPTHRLMIETDAPFLLPVPLAKKGGDRRNEPALLVHVLETVARALGRSAQVVAEETTRTARAFFGLDVSDRVSKATVLGFPG